MVAIALAFGLTAVLAPIHFEKASRVLLAAPILAVVLLYGHGADGQLSRADGALLVALYLASFVGDNMTYLHVAMSYAPALRMRAAEARG